MASGGKLSGCICEYATKGKVGTPEGQMTTKDVTQLLTHAGLMKKTGKWTSNNLDITFTKNKTKGQNAISGAQLQKLIEDMCAQKPQDDVETILDKVAATKKSDHLKTKTSKTGGVDRMTDTSKYTGAHKERFDESGKGKGADGRVDKADTSGYVGNYKGDGTYGKK